MLVCDGSVAWPTIGWLRGGATIRVAAYRKGNTMYAQAIEILNDLLAQLPKGHSDRPGIVRAIEVLSHQDKE